LNNFFDPGETGNNFFRNAGTLLPAAMTSRPANSNRHHHHHHHQLTGVKTSNSHQHNFDKKHT
jgi:hypothetical protein